jgi:Bardet-Biedl syndrome 2 protein
MQETLIRQINEADEVTAVCNIGRGRFGYTLANCTVGVYAGSNRVWRIKSKNAAHCICAHDFDGSGEMQLLSGWSNGKVGH